MSNMKILSNLISLRTSSTVLNGSDRTKLLQRNIISNILVKGVSVVISFLLVRVTFDFLNETSIYGVWLTILGVLSWINLLDIGLGNGLRNKLAEQIALEDWKLGKQYVSTAFSVLGLIVALLFVLYLIGARYLHWNSIFNISKITINLTPVMSVILVSYLGVFFFTIINSIAHANQDSFIPGFISLVTNSSIVLLLFLFGAVGISGLSNLTLIYCGSTLSVLILFTIYLFRNKYAKIRPSIRYINKTLIKDIVGLGFKFFVLQIMNVVIFSSSSMVILQILGPSEVTKYQIVLKIFSVLTIISSLIMTPMWSAFTDAYVKEDFTWIRRTIRKIMFLMIPFTILAAIITLFGNYFIQIWLKRTFDIGIGLYTLMSIFTLMTIWSTFFSYLLNGISKSNIQLAAVIFGGIINIPLAIYFSRDLNMGIEGVVLASICALSAFAVAGPLQVYHEFFAKKKQQASSRPER